MIMNNIADPKLKLHKITVSVKTHYIHSKQLFEQNQRHET